MAIFKKKIKKIITFVCPHCKETIPSRDIYWDAFGNGQQKVYGCPHCKKVLGCSDWGA